MLESEKMVKQFEFGISILTAYLRYNDKNNYTDINVLSEGFARDLLNILYDLKVSTTKRHNSPGYDLISEQKRIVVQISTTCTPKKVNHSFNTLEHAYEESMRWKKELELRLAEVDNKQKYRYSDERAAEKERIKQDLSKIIDIRGYRVIFLFLTENADSVLKYGKRSNSTFEIPLDFKFNQELDVICFDSIIRTVKDLSFDEDAKKIERLKSFMNRNANLFIQRESVDLSNDHVDGIIKEYANNFTQPLFLHRYRTNTRVTLKNLFVEPSISSAVTLKQYHGSVISLLDSFLWDCDKDRILFIDGDAAIGKTSLISWLCYHYIELDDVGKSIFFDTKLVCIRLRDLTLSSEDTIETCILKYLSLNSLNDFEAQYNKSLIILEGIDELGLVGGFGSITIEQFIISVRHLFSNHKILITSRPKFINMDILSGSAQTFSFQHFSLDHFSKEKRNCWISNYENSDKCGEIIPESTKQYLDELKDEDALGVADTPLALYLLVACEITETLKNNKWALYHEIFHEAIRNTPYNESFRHSGDTQYHIALQDDDFAEDVYRTIGEIANRMFVNAKEERFYISSIELDEIISNLFINDRSDRIKAIRKCCVLCAYWKENTNTGALEFYHNNIRDFFMCEYIYQRFFDHRSFSNSIDFTQKIIQTACDVFQHGMIAHTTWAQTFTFLFYRLRYEKSINNYSENLIKKKLANEFSSIFFAFVNENTMWMYTFNKSPYESIKATFLNSALFLRLCSYAESSEMLDTFSSKNYYDFYHGHLIFKDWIRIFSDYVDISNTRHIAFSSKTKFENVEFKHAALTSACFEESGLYESSFLNADLSHSNFSCAYLEHVDFSEADLSYADFSNATLIGVIFTSANLYNACFENATIKDVVWPEKISSLERSSFSDAQIYNSKFKNWNFNHVNLDSTKFFYCTFHNVQFSDSVRNLYFSSCTISKSVFNSADSIVFNGDKSEILYVDFRGQIYRCVFRKMVISNSSWTDASIDNVLFDDTQIDNLEFRGARVHDVRFKNSVITGNVDVFKARLKSSVASYLRNNVKNLLNIKTIEVIR